MHRYQVTTRWSGSTAGGYESYDRTHTVDLARETLRVSADPMFRGDLSLLNPEQLLVASAASCQLLSFLAVAARARIDVRSYDDLCEGVMPADDLPLRITRITLTPTVTVGPGVSENRVRHLLQVAHRECYIANSLKSEIRIEPTIVVEEG